LTSLFGSAPPVEANDYGEREVNQNQFIAVAVPFGQRQYNLIVLEQIPGQAVCWSESGSQPVMVEPLLLKFDFTGSCRRATDSNGYSIRLNGQDYGLNYLLSIVERSGELFEVADSSCWGASSRRNFSGQKLRSESGMAQNLTQSRLAIYKADLSNKNLGSYLFN